MLRGNENIKTLNTLLATLLEEVIEAKASALELLKLEPENKDFHRIYGMYVGQALDIRKEILKGQALDRDRLLIDALRGVVEFLLEKEKNDAALFIGEHLKNIGNRIKEKWEAPDPTILLTGVTKKSSRLSGRPSPRSAKAQRSRKKKEDAAP